MAHRVTNKDQISIFEGLAIAYKRNDVWQFKCWLKDENKGVRRSLHTTSKTEAIKRAQQMYIDLIKNKDEGKRYFSITTKEAVEDFLKFKQEQAEDGVITKGRLTTVRSHLNHFLRHVHKDSKIGDLHADSLDDYVKSRKKLASPHTIRTEINTINQMMGWLYKRKHVTFEKFDTKNDRELQKIAKEVDSTEIRRQTFESDEYEEFILKMRTYVSKKQATIEKLTEQQYADRQLAREYFLFISNTGLRTREARLLRWEDVTRIDEKLTEIHVRKETSKWGKSRDLTERVWHILERWAKVSKELYGRTAEGIIFSRDGKTEFDRGQFNTHFNAIKGMMENIDERKRQSLVPYSFRHWYITKKYTAGVPLQALTKVCGTSMEWIEKTYSHLNKELQLNVALAGNKRNKDGTLEVRTLSR